MPGSRSHFFSSVTQRNDIELEVYDAFMLDNIAILINMA
jgi:hypothetical protein